jgi:hypothetical protein
VEISELNGTLERISEFADLAFGHARAGDESLGGYGVLLCAGGYKCQFVVHQKSLEGRLFY